MATDFPFKQLPARYGLNTRQAIYDRMNAAGIKPFKDEGGRTCISQEDLAVLDELDRFRKSNPDLPLSQFTRSSVVEVVDTPVDNPVDRAVDNALDRVVDNPVDRAVDNALDRVVDNALDSELDREIELARLTQLISAIAELVAPEPAPLQRYEALEKAASNGWLVTTEELKQLTGTRPLGTNKVWGCFEFIKSGRLGRHQGWRIRKIAVDE